MIGVVGVVTSSLLGASSAAAVLNWPQHAGDGCVATGTTTAQTAIALSNNDRTLPYPEVSSNAPDESGSVITRWKVNAPAGVGPIAEQLVATHGTFGEELQLIGESSVETVVSGAANEFLTRIPVPPDAQIGLRGPDGALVCDGAPLHAAMLVPDAWALGESRHLTIEDDTGVPVVATLEPDRDGDGYGDETQDQCLEQPLLHTACPFVRLRPNAKVYRRGILVEVSTGDPTKVEVTGQVGWGYQPRGGGPHKRLVVGLSGGAQEVGAGATVPFWMPLPAPVLQRLARLTSKEKLKAHLAIVATDVVGHQTNRAMGVRLPGWAKPHPPRSSR